MSDPLSHLPNGSIKNQNLSILVGNILVCLMMLTVAVGVVQLGGRIAPNWRSGYLVLLCPIIALESLYTRKQARLFEGREKMIFRGSEWIAIAVAIKAIIYLVNDPAQILEDLPDWQNNFFESFFTAEFLVVLILALGIWWSSAAFAKELEELNDREKETEWDDLGKLQNALKDIRNRISTRIFIIGSLIVIMAVASRVDPSVIFRARGIPPPGYQSPVANVLGYFILALVMLSLTQFALMRTRWSSQRLPVSPSLGRNWIQYGLTSFVILAIVVFFLPTEYSLGLLDTLRFSLEFLIKAFSFLVMLITLPITFCLSLFRFVQAGGDTPGPPPLLMPPPATEPRQPLAWLEVLRSLAFWIIFVGIILVAMRYFLMQNSALWNTVRTFPFLRWLGRTLGDLWTWLKGTNRQLTGLVRSGIKRLRPQNIHLPAQTIRRLFNLSRLGPREKVVFYYLSLVQLGSERGLERRPAQTPSQYERQLTFSLPEINDELHEPTDSFLEARYSPHPVNEPDADEAASSWERIKTILRNWRKPDG